MSDNLALSILHWFWMAFFAGFGVYLLLRPDCMMRSSCVLRVRDCSDVQRVQAAVERRRSVERLSNVTGYAAAAFAFILAAIAGFSHVEPGLLYATFCLGLALAMSSIYLQLRNGQPKRVAVLAARAPGTVIPLWIFALAGISAASCLSLVFVPKTMAAAFIVSLSTTITIVAAWRLTSLPALLQGIDLPVETALDDRLRFQRSAAVLVLAVVQPFVFCSQTLALHLVAWSFAPYGITLAAWLAFSFWIMRKQLVKVTLAPQ